MTVHFNGEDLAFKKDESPSNKAGVNIHWNDVKFDPKDIKMIATALKGKKEKLELIAILADAGVFKAADILTFSVASLV